MTAADRPAVHVPERVIADVAAAAARGVAGVARLARTGQGLASVLAGSPVATEVTDGAVRLHVRVIAREDSALGPLAEAVRRAVATAVERQLRLTVREVTVVVAGIGD